MTPRLLAAEPDHKVLAMADRGDARAQHEAECRALRYSKAQIDHTLKEQRRVAGRVPEDR